MDKRFPVTDLLVTAALLDPRCFDLEVVNKYIKDQLLTSKERLLEEQVMQHVMPEDIVTHKSTISGTGSKATEQDASKQQEGQRTTTAKEIMELSKKYSQGESLRAAAIEKECKIFLSTAMAEDVADNNLMRFWRERCFQFPWLSALARRTLCIQATSTPSERVFSIAGLTVTAKRNNLDPARVDIIIFVHENHEECKSVV